MKDTKLLILNMVAIGSFILYGMGIYLIVAVLGKEWGNIAVDLALQMLGPLYGVILVIVIGSLILLISYYIQKLRKINVFLCWFWILSLYQCAINSFLQFAGLPDEPINHFFKSVFAGFWYPAKELFFLGISLFLTYFWVKRISKENFTHLDLSLIALTSFILVGGTVISQLFLMN